MTRDLDPRDAGYRLARVGRESAETKGRRYLLEGRLMVRYCGPEGVRAIARGCGEVYRVSYKPGRGWSCTCRASTRCAHLIAAQLVVVVPSRNGRRESSW